MKKTALTVPVILIIALCLSVSVWAGTQANPTPLSLDTPITLTMAVDAKEYFSFTPAETGYYNFSSSGYLDPEVTLYQGNIKLDDNDDGGSNCNFSLTYELQAGVTYTYEVHLLFYMGAGSFDVVLKRGSDVGSGTYNPGDIAVINRIIDENGVYYYRGSGSNYKWDKAPADGSSVPSDWLDYWNDGGVQWSNDATNKRIVRIAFYTRISSNSYVTIPMTGNLDLRGLDALEELYCGGHDITGLNVSGCTKLKELNSFSCKHMTELDLSSNTALEELNCAYSDLVKLKLGNLPKLTFIDCRNNKLASLDVSGCPKLSKLHCYNNNFKYYYDIKGVKSVREVLYDPQNVTQVGPAGGKYTIIGTVKDNRGNRYPFKSLGLRTQIGNNSDCWVYPNGGELDTGEFDINTSFSEGYPLGISVSTDFSYYNGSQIITEPMHYSAGVPFYPEAGYTYEISCMLPISFGSWSSGNMDVWLLSSKVTVPVTSVKLNASSKTLAIGGATTLTATLSPYTATNKYVTWKSSNTSVATVEPGGKVTAKAPGKATITVTTHDGAKKATCVITVKPQKPTSLKTKVVSATGAKISWVKVSGASGYQVQRATSKTGTYSSVKNTTSTSFTNTGLTAGKTYYYKVRAYKTVDGAKVYSDDSVVVSVKPKPLKVTGIKAAKVKSGQAKISWSKQANVSGYQIVRATSKNGTYKSVGTTTKLTFKNTKLTPGKTYYYKVRAYKTVSGKKIYGAYSGIKSVKV